MNKEEKRRIADEQAMKLFGKPIKEMDVEEVLLAISGVANKLHHNTGQSKYKDIEDVATLLLDGETKGIDSKTNVDNAVKMLKGRGYREPDYPKE